MKFEGKNKKLKGMVVKSTTLEEFKSTSRTKLTPEEIVYILEGQGTIVLDGKSETIYPGNIFLVKEGQSRVIHNRTDQVLRFVSVFNRT
jgi:uncharacterized cupin superfamily protein